MRLNEYTADAEEDMKNCDISHLMNLMVVFKTSSLFEAARTKNMHKNTTWR